MYPGYDNALLKVLLKMTPQKRPDDVEPEKGKRGAEGQPQIDEDTRLLDIELED